MDVKVEVLPSTNEVTEDVFGEKKPDSPDGVRTAVWYIVINAVLARFIYTAVQKISVLIATNPKSNGVLSISAFFFGALFLLLSGKSKVESLMSLLNRKSWQTATLVYLAVTFVILKIISIFLPSLAFLEMETTIGMLVALLIVSFPGETKAVSGLRYNAACYLSFFLLLAYGACSFYVMGQAEGPKIYSHRFSKEEVMAGVGIGLSALVLLLSSFLSGYNEEEEESVINIFSVAALIVLLTPTLLHVRQHRYLAYEFILLLCVAYRHYNGKAVRQNPTGKDEAFEKSLRIAAVVGLPYMLEIFQIIHGKIVGIE
jgi:hypothetical protein